MTHYQQQIIKATGCKESDTHEIEEYMREIVLHSTLDWLTITQFNKAARTAWKDIQWMRSPEGIKYMEELEQSMLN